MPTVSKGPAVKISERCQLWAVASDTYQEKAYQVVVLPDGQASCSCPSSSMNECKHIRRVRVERGESAVRVNQQARG